MMTRTRLPGRRAVRPGGDQPCAIRYNRQSAAVAGRVVRQPRGRPHALVEVRLTETFAGGGAATLRWRTGWEGEDRFEGLEPGADIVLQLAARAPAVRLPRLAPGQRYQAPDIAVAEGCSPRSRRSRRTPRRPAQGTVPARVQCP